MAILKHIWTVMALLLLVSVRIFVSGQESLSVANVLLILRPTGGNWSSSAKMTIFPGQEVDELDWRWVTVLAAHKDHEPRNLYSFLTTSGTLNDNPGKELEPVADTVSNGSFKSHLLDQWATYSPHKVRVTLWGSRGLWWSAEFNTTGASKDPSTWLTRSAMTYATDKDIRDDEAALVTFDSTQLSIIIDNGGNARLQMTWNPTPQYLVSTKWWPYTPPPLIALPMEPFDETIDSKLETSTSFSYTWGSSYVMFFNSNQYLVGMAINKTGSGHISKFLISYSNDKDCKDNWGSGEGFQYYTDAAGQPVEFVPKFNGGSTGTFGVIQFDDIVAGICIKLNIEEIVDPPECTIFTYSVDNSVLEAPVFALQWWMDVQATPTPVEASSADTLPLSTPNLICTTVTVCSTVNTDDVTGPSLHVTADVTNLTSIDEVVKEIKSKLSVPREVTSKFKRQFYSVPDNRYSAVLIGVVGVVTITMVIVGVVLLDSRTIFKHLKHVKSNLRSLGKKRHSRHSAQPAGD